MAFRLQNNKVQSFDEGCNDVGDVNTNTKSDRGRQDAATETFKAFADDTSLHGARFLFVGGFFRRLLWTAALVTCFGYCVYQVYSTASAFGERPFNTKITTKTAKKNTKLPFPAVTICNLNLMNRRKYLEFQKGKNISDEEIEYKLGVYAKFLSQSQDVFNNESKQRNPELFWRFTEVHKEVDWLSLFTQEIEEMLLPHSLFNSCFINGVICRAENFTKFSSSFFGQCQTFNSGHDGHPVLNATMAGHQNGLKLLLNIERNNYLDNPLHPFVGLTALVHDQETYPSLEQFGFLVQPGFRTACAIKRREIINLESPYETNCTDPNKTPDMFKDTPYKYSKPACLMECLTKFIIKSCGCRPIEYKDKDIPNCAPNDSVLCMYPAYRTFGTSKERDECVESCTEPCKHTEYETSLSYAGLQRNMFIEKLNSSFNITNDLPFYEDFLKMSVTEKMAFIDDNIISLDIYFQDMSYDEVRQIPVFEEWTLIANLGGNFGLFLGMSILTVLEFVEFVLRRIFFFICKK